MKCRFPIICCSLLAVALALWAWSYFWITNISYAYFQLISMDGHIYGFCGPSFSPLEVQEERIAWGETLHLAWTPDHQFAGFAFGFGGYVFIPWWFPCGLTTLATLLVLRKSRKLSQPAFPIQPTTSGKVNATSKF